MKKFILATLTIGIMLLNPILSSARGPVAIEPTAGDFYSGLFNKYIQNPEAFDVKSISSELPLAYIITGNKIAAQAVKGTQIKTSQAFADYQAIIDNADKDSVNVITLEGALMKNDYCGSPGMATIGSMLQYADASDNIMGHILYIDSPGGTVAGTEDLSKIVKSLNKPVVSLISGVGASAAYWIASASDEIYTAGETTMVGSIGTVWALSVYKSENYKEHVITSDQTPNKGKAGIEASKGNYTLIKEEMLNPLAATFINTVLDNRKGKIKGEYEGTGVAPEPINGKMYLGQTAQDLGLIDGYNWNITMAANRVAELANNDIIHYS